MSLHVLILAAGQGVRMRSDLPKVLHEAGGRPLLDHVIATAQALGAARIGAVVGAGREAVEGHLRRRFPDVGLAVQDPPRGTGDAVRCALPLCAGARNVVVLSGDVPLLRPETVAGLVRAVDDGAACALLTAVLPGAGSYGRVVRGTDGRLVRIVEAKDASAAEEAIQEVNAGIYVFERHALEARLPRLTPANAQGEYYLTDVLGFLVADGLPVTPFVASDALEVQGVNNRADLAVVDLELRRRAAHRAMLGGATLVRPETITLDDTVEIAPDAVVEPFVTLRGATKVGKGSRIGQGSVLVDTVIGERVEVRPYCVMESAFVGATALVGPFARLREGTDLAEGVHVGNFVETKKARIGTGSKANHLSYLGDAEIGAGVNVGAGTITCNYDGLDKHKTVLEDGVFVGSDTQLVAPVTVGKGAYVGAGTTVTDDVPEGALAVSRTKQRNIDGWGARRRQQIAEGKAARAAGKKA